jgi:DegV family protein with EDD domain
MSIAIVTDSTCDIPSRLTDQYHIHIVPNIVVIGGVGFEDNKNFSRREFYDKLPDMQPMPTTATASSGTYKALYEKLLQSYDRILAILASHHLSGIFNAASLAAREFDGRVRVVDSLQVSLGLGFQVLEAAQSALDGLSEELIIARINEVRRRTRLVAMLDTLEYLRRSGRVSWARAGLGSVLRIKPFVELKAGLVERAGEVRTRKKGIARLIDLLRNLGPLDKLGILHSNAEEDAHEILATLSPQIPELTLVVNVTTVIGTHVGPNGLGFVALFNQSA